MNEEFSGGGHEGVGALENKGWDHCENFGRWERKGRVMGVLKGWKAGEKGKLPSNALNLQSKNG